MDKLFKYFGKSLFCMLMGFLFGVLFIPEAVASMMLTGFFIFIIVILVVALFTKRTRKETHIKFSMNFVYGFAALEGIMLYPAFLMYLSDLGIVIFINVIAGALIYFFLLAKHSAKQNSGTYLSLGNKLFPALIVLILLSVVNLFLGIPIFYTIISIFSLILFSLYVLFDISQFKRDYEMGYIQERDDYSIHVLNIFIDFINILLDLLQIISDLR